MTWIRVKRSAISVASDGTQANDYSFAPSISADGRLVAFTSSASNLVSGDSNGFRDAFVHDRETGETRRVSVATDGGQGNGFSSGTAISADGRSVVFLSNASNLGAGDSNRDSDVFIHDLASGETQWVPVQQDPNQIFAGSASPAISGDGQVVTYRRDIDRNFAVFAYQRTPLPAQDLEGNFHQPMTDSEENGEVVVDFNTFSAQGMQAVSLAFIEGGPRLSKH